MAMFELTLLDKSNYLKGLMVLAKKDNRLIESEKNLIREAGSRLGFSKDFYEDTLKYLMVNKYIDESPLKFSSPVVARMFIGDGLKLAYADHGFVPEELQYLKNIALNNEIGEENFHKMVDEFNKASGE